MNHSSSLSSSLDPETEETALLLMFWVPLADGPAAEQKQKKQKILHQVLLPTPSPDEQCPPYPVVILDHSMLYQQRKMADEDNTEKKYERRMGLAVNEHKFKA